MLLQELKEQSYKLSTSDRLELINAIATSTPKIAIATSQNQAAIAHFSSCLGDQC